MPPRKQPKRDSEAIQARASQAKSLLENALIREALDYWEACCKDTFANSQPDQKEVRELAYQQLHAGRVVRSYLTRVVNAGKVDAQKQAAAAQAAHGGSGVPGDQRTH